jgi:hypothetical protein
MDSTPQVEAYRFVLLRSNPIFKYKRMVDSPDCSQVLSELVTVVIRVVANGTEIEEK